MKAERLIKSGCEGYIAFIVEDKQPQVVEDILVVHKFPNIFPEEIPRLPSVRERDLSIDLIPGTTPISKAPYWMAPAELKELKVQLQELVDEEFIKPWGASGPEFGFFQTLVTFESNNGGLLIYIHWSAEDA